MKFKISKNDLIGILSKVQGITSRKSNFATTECVMFDVSSKGIMIKATDHETGFEGYCDAEVEKEGKIALNSRKLYEIVKEFPSAIVSFDMTENNWIEIKDSKVQYHLMGIDHNEFPRIPEIELENEQEVDAQQFKRMIERSIAIGTPGDEKRAHINGVFFEFREDFNPPLVRMVSTDGTRLAKTDIAVEKISAKIEDSGVLIPKKGIAEALKFLDTDGVVNIGIIESYFIVKKADDKIIIRLIEGTFPKYEDIINREDGLINIEVEKEPFMKMLVRMAIMCNENYRAAIFRFDGDELTINSTNPELGESKEDIEIKYGGDRIELAFNPKYMIDALNAIDDKYVILNFVDEEKPCIVSGKEDKNYLNVIMPMKI